MIAEYNGYTVEWDGDFKFGVASHNAFKVEKNVVPTQVVGACFLSGFKDCSVVYLDTDGSTQSFQVSGPYVYEADFEIADIPADMPWALCGPGVEDARLVSAKCREGVASCVSVCPLVGPLAAFGYLVGGLALQGKERPRRTLFCEPYDDIIMQDVQEFDPRLEGDGYGKMAHVIISGKPVVNQMMRTPCVSPFYGKVISADRWWGEPTFLLLPTIAAHYFPTELLSVRNYAASHVPVFVRNNDEFAKDSGYEEDDVKIFVANDITPGLGSMLRFCNAMGGNKFAIASNPQSFTSIPESIPLFRWLGAYNVDKELFREAVFNET